jgi:hypothetical protein
MERRNPAARWGRHLAALPGVTSVVYHRKFVAIRESSAQMFRPILRTAVLAATCVRFLITQLLPASLGGVTLYVTLATLSVEKHVVQMDRTTQSLPAMEAVTFNVTLATLSVEKHA